MIRYQWTPFARVVALVLSLAVLHPAAGFAQVNVGAGGGSFTGGNVTGATSFLDGTNFSINNTADPTKQIQFSAASITTGTARTYTMPNVSSTVCVAGADCAFSVGQTFTLGVLGATGGALLLKTDSASGQEFLFDAGSFHLAELNAGTSNLKILGGYYFAWVSGTDATAAADTFIGRDGAAAVQLGADVNGAAVNQRLQAHDGITGSNIIGADLMLSSGVGTGNAAGSQTDLGRALMTGTGTTQQTRTQGLTVCESKTLSNTTATATALANVTLASNSAGSARVTVTVTCTDGTNFDSDIVTSYVAYVNKATVVTVGTPVTTASAAANNSGSCTVAPTFVTNGNSIDIKVTPAFTTIVPTTVTGYINVENLGAGVVACQ